MMLSTGLWIGAGILFVLVNLGLTFALIRALSGWRISMARFAGFAAAVAFAGLILFLLLTKGSGS